MSERRELFDDWAEVYDKSMEDTAGFPFEGYEGVLDKIVGGAGVGDGDRILDVGTGTGALAARFARCGCRVLGIDLSEKMLAQARRNVPKAEFRQLDLLGDWDDETYRFNKIVSAYVLHEFELKVKLELLAKFAKLLEPGGHVIIGDISFGTARALAAARREWENVWDDSEHYWVAEDALLALKKLGFNVSYVQVSFCAGVYVLQVR